MAGISQIKLPNGTGYELKDEGALQLIGGMVTGVVTFGNSIVADDITTGTLIVNGGIAVTNGINASWLNGSGAALTNLNASNISSGTLSAARLPDTYVSISQRGVANGVAPLNSSNKIDSTYLPSYVDDVLEYDAKSSFPSTGETGKIYVDKTTNLTWRWGGSAYVEISPSLAIGNTSSTAAAGNHIHGNITNGGNISASANIASGDKLVIHDYSANTIVNSSIDFGNDTTAFLSNAGTWVIPDRYLLLTGGSVTGNVNFGSTIAVDSLTAGSLIVTGNSNFNNGILVSTINGVNVGSNPNFNNSITHIYAGDGTAANVATTNGNTKVTIADDNVVRGSITIIGGSGITVTSDDEGNITIALS